MCLIIVKMQIKQSDFIDKIDTYAESNFNEYVNDSISYDELMRKYSTNSKCIWQIFD